MNLNRKVKLKGQLKLYMQWPFIMSILLIGMNIWMYTVDKNAGMLMSAFVVVYLIIAAVLYFCNRDVIMSDLIEFATQYGLVQNQLLKTLDVPYILVLDDGKIIWSNDSFRNNISDAGRKEKYISKIMPELNRSIFPSEEDQDYVLELVHEDTDYLIELKKVGISHFTKHENLVDTASKDEGFIAISFRDVTELNHHVKEVNDQQLIAGLIYIDNYDEVMDSIEEYKQALATAVIERNINQYIGGLDGLIKKLEKDKFFVVFKRMYIEKIEEDRFSLLEEVKQINIGSNRMISLSIGLGLSKETYAQSYNYARVAIDLAMARGGDQAIYKNGNSLQYFGGKGEQSAKNTRVKARVKAEALREFIEGKDQVIAMGHKLADVDSFGAAIGIYRASLALGKKAYIVINEITTSIRPFYDSFVNSPDYPMDMFLTTEEVTHYLTEDTMVVVVDTNKPQMCDCEEILEVAKTIAVFDHHRQESVIIENAVLSYIEPYASSTCEMVSEILQYIVDDIKIQDIEADCMYAGILIDTNNFMNRTGVRTFEAAAFLRRSGADITRVRKTFREDMVTYRAKAEAIKDAEVYRGEYAIAMCKAKDIESPTILGAQISNELLDINGIRASFVLTEYNDVIYMSTRAIDEMNVQIVAERLGGGGHINVAGAQFRDLEIEEVTKQIKLTLDEMIQKGDI